MNEMQSLDDMLTECEQALDNADSDEQRRSVLIFVYAKGIGAAMRAKGHWPSVDYDEQSENPPQET